MFAADIVDCTFTDNSTSVEAGDRGGGIFCNGRLTGTGLQFCGNVPDAVFAGDRTSLGISCNPCPADIDGDGQVAVPDLLTLLAAWGACQ